MPRHKTGNRGRKLTTAETMHARVGTSPAALLRLGLSPAAVARLEREWERWDAESGFAWRTLAGIPTPADRARLEAGDEPGDPVPPEAAGASGSSARAG
jgi:hypothetical protein